MTDQNEQTGRYEKRFGNIAVEMNFITPQKLFEALSIQVVEFNHDK